ncbi:MAG: peptidylprolyl isomerase, partial [Nonlabens sp.]
MKLTIKKSGLTQFKKRIAGTIILAIILVCSQAGIAQTALATTLITLPASALVVGKDTTKQISTNRVMIDAVAGVIGDYVILDSDITKEVQVQQRNGNNLSLTKCELIESLLQAKMFAHHAIQDSITVSDDEVEGMTARLIDRWKSKLGTDQNVANFYNRENIEEVKSELNIINRDRLLADRMQQRLTQSVEITPEEVRQFFAEIPEDEIPLFNTEVNMSQIMVQPKPDQQSIDETIANLNEYRNAVLNEGSSFAAKATLHSDDAGTEQQGGVITLTRSDPYVTAFKDQAFSLQEGEISEPFETIFGWHILMVQKVRGQVREVRHILNKPFISTAQLNKAKRELDAIRDKIVLKEMTFADAAREISDQKETAVNGGQLTNPQNGGNYLEISKIPAKLAAQVEFMEIGDVSPIMTERSDLDPELTVFKLIYINDKIADHKADYQRDFLKIKDLAKKKKEIERVRKWQQDKLKDTYIR